MLLVDHAAGGAVRCLCGGVCRDAALALALARRWASQRHRVRHRNPHESADVARYDGERAAAAANGYARAGDPIGRPGHVQAAR
eukprot:6831369-Prymnesium_polylepis.1